MTEKLCFVTDNDGHWYKIPVSKREDFHEWVEYIESYIDPEDSQDFDFDKYDSYRCMHPTNYMFNDIEVLKENE